VQIAVWSLTHGHKLFWGITQFILIVQPNKKKTKSNSFINDLKYTSDDGKDQVASTDTDKADVLSKFFPVST